MVLGRGWLAGRQPPRMVRCAIETGGHRPPLQGRDQRGGSAGASPYQTENGAVAASLYQSLLMIGLFWGMVSLENIFIRFDLV